MVEHPAARALTGYLLVRGGVHQVAYARALERLTGADMMKLFPSPRIPTDKIPECQPHLERGEHLKLYRFSQDAFQEVAAVFVGPAPRDRRAADRRRRASSGRRAGARPTPAAGRLRTELGARGDRRDRGEAPRPGRPAEAPDRRGLQGVRGPVEQPDDEREPRGGKGQEREGQERREGEGRSEGSIDDSCSVAHCDAPADAISLEVMLSRVGAASGGAHPWPRLQPPQTVDRALPRS